MKKQFLTILAVFILLSACDEGSGDFPDLTLDAYINASYEGTFVGDGSTTETVTYTNIITYSFVADVDITITDGTWECTINDGETITGTLAGTAVVTYSADSVYEDYLPTVSSTPFTGTIFATLDGSALTMTCEDIDIYDYGSQDIILTGTVTNGIVDGTWELTDSDVSGSFEGERSDS
ncbi:MAG: hypothetical protein PQJ59_12965 [Spirochaetales bacterium]|nr:hypothetical protein [Spirochaetales bacterium]